ncbi:glycosyltransferase family 4 protein [Ancylobacter sp. 6x-1]|uniref:Glycosyltransferase family 4 protein n=1 Tax=Ancylobacter crimeensis TaxID=2579147 RepID=A0ABT0DBD2_9HYPH|nr:glycosyltransferase family 1 protein [Ancylobacter crimeensis]MCK0197271.1 glycosyltransferase family 4 protein [Ancylobacter crimeensis]
MRRHWAINGRFLTQKVTGVQRYAREIVEALDRRIAAGDPLTRGLDVELLVPAGAATTLHLTAIRPRVVGPARGPLASGHLWEQFSLPRGLEGGLISLGNGGPLLHRRQIACIHDVSTRSFPQSYSVPFRLLQRVMVPAIGRAAAMISTVSHHSAGELTERGLCAADKLLVAPNGHEHTRHWHPQHTPATRAVAGPGTIVLLGSPAPHKNMDLLLGIADRLAAQDLQLAIVGNVDGRVLRNGGDRATGENIHWLGRLSDDALAALLQDSLCLAFPSFVEGFGLPLLEAMAIGCPVVTSDTASMPEVCGPAALYASPGNPDAWMDRFARLRREEGLRERMIAAGHKRTQRFSWHVSAGLYLEAMAALDGLAEARWGAGKAGGIAHRILV